MKKYLFWLLVILAFYSCKTKKKEIFFPVLSFIKSQVAHVDTSLYPIKKIIWLDSIQMDPIYVKREEFRNLAKDFLEIPDLTDKKFRTLYTEEKFYDAGLNQVIFSYIPKKPDVVLIRRQEVLITPDPSGDKIKNIIIDLFIAGKDSSVQKKMLWRVDQSFQVATIVQKNDQAESTSILKVAWNEKEDE